MGIKKNSKRNGICKVTFTVPVVEGSEVRNQFRYLLDNNRWENDPEADKSAATPFGDARNSVIVI